MKKSKSGHLTDKFGNLSDSPEYSFSNWSVTEYNLSNIAKNSKIVVSTIYTMWKNI